MSRKTLWLMLIGNLCMTFSLFTSPFFAVSESAGDFLKGFGVALVIGAFFLEVKRKRTSNAS
jgi:hypothetical protein